MADVQPLAPQPQKKTSGFKKFLRWFVFICVVALVVGFWFKYYFSYSDGTQGGKMQKISHKGNIFKTWEGYLLISTSITDNNLSLTTDKFYFSVEQDSVAHLLEKYEGKRVKVKYRQMHGTLPWRGDSEYIVDEAVLDQ